MKKIVVVVDEMPYYHHEIQNEVEHNLFAIIIEFAMPWPIIPHPNPTTPYTSP